MTEKTKKLALLSFAGAWLVALGIHTYLQSAPYKANLVAEKHEEKDYNIALNIPKIFEKRAIKVESDGPWVTYHYSINAPIDVGVSKDILNSALSKGDLNISKEDMSLMKNYLLDIRVAINTAVCQNETLSELIYKNNIGVRVELETDDKATSVLSIDTIPYTCDIFNKNIENQEKFLADLKTPAKSQL